jgi:hypothetical protein
MRAWFAQVLEQEGISDARLFEGIRKHGKPCQVECSVWE